MTDRDALTPAAVIGRAPGLLSTEVGGELVLMSVAAGKYFSFDEAGSAIWRCFEQATSVAAAVQTLSQTFDADAGVIERDVLRLLGDLRAHGLIAVNQ